jgi:hypothetical protein
MRAYGMRPQWMDKGHVVRPNGIGGNAGAPRHLERGKLA